MGQGDTGPRSRMEATGALARTQPRILHLPCGDGLYPQRYFTNSDRSTTRSVA